MKELNEYRERISEIDEKMAALFCERMRASAGIAAYKKERGLPVKDEKREAALIAANRERIKDEELERYYIDFLKNVIGVSCAYQEMLMSGMKVAYSGVPGAYAYIAAKRLFPKAQLVCKQNFREAYMSVGEGGCDCVVLPLENSYAGEVSTVMDLAFSGDLFVNQVIDLPIEHCLLGVEGAVREGIKTVTSHPQALSQCAKYIDRHWLKTMESSNTARAAEKVKELGDPTVAAIASAETAQLVGLSILDEGIQDSGINTTRFAVFSKTMSRQGISRGSDDENFILVFTVKNTPGALAQTLNIIGAHGYNMRSVRSRPMKELAWNYYFFIEAEGNIHTTNGQDMLNELNAVCARLKLVGSYSTCAVNR